MRQLFSLERQPIIHLELDDDQLRIELCKVAKELKTRKPDEEMNGDADFDIVIFFV